MENGGESEKKRKTKNNQNQSETVAPSELSTVNTMWDWK